jgi:hypothetical protein
MRMTALSASPRLAKLPASDGIHDEDDGFPARHATAVNQIEYCIHQREKKLLANVGIDDDDDDDSNRISNGEGVTRQRWD